MCSDRLPRPYSSELLFCLSLNTFAAPVSIIPYHTRQSFAHHQTQDGKEQPTHSPSDMPLQPLLPILMHRMPLPNLTQTVPHQELVIPRREQRRRHIDQDGDPAVVHVGEGFAAEEDGGHDPRAQVSGQVGGDGDVGEAPDHGGVGEADGEGGAGGGDEGVGGVEAGPDYDADVGVDEELGQEEVAEVSRCGIMLVEVFSVQGWG